MKRMFGLLLLSAFSLSFLFACSNKVNNDKDVENLVNEYKTEQYTIKEPSNALTGIEIGEIAKEYLTKDTLDNLKANREFDLAPNLAKKINKSIALEEV